MNNDSATSQLLYWAAEAKWQAALEAKRPFMILRPRIYPDGNAWCAVYGDNIQDGVCGFGDTPEKAAVAFDLAWLNQKALHND